MNSTVTNIYPTDIVRFPLRAAQRADVAAARRIADRICRGYIAETYIRHAFNAFKEGFIYKQGTEEVSVSFCIWKVRSVPSIQGTVIPELFIYLVCSVPQPFQVFDMILYDVERYCYEKGVRYITLEPAGDALREYYRTKGFTESYMPQRMVKEVATPIVFQAARRRTTTARRRGTTPKTETRSM